MNCGRNKTSAGTRCGQDKTSFVRKRRTQWRDATEVRPEQLECGDTPQTVSSETADTGESSGSIPGIGLAERPAGQPAGQPAGRPAGWPAGKPAGRPAGWLVRRPAGRPA